MKKIFVSLTIIASLFAGTAHADGWHHHGGGYSNTGWVAPALIGGIIGYELSRPNTVYVQPQPPVYVQQQPVIVQQQPPVYVQPQPVPQYVCELRSEMINGRVVQGQFCHN